jgi:Transglutaminase-like superfamily
MAEHLVDSDNPLVQATAVRLLQGCSSPGERLQRLVSYVRDDILFGFPRHGDMTAASDTIRMGIGQCNTKGTLLLALCQVAGIPARLHFAPIRKSIQRGLYTGIWYELLPKYLSHAWVEVEIDGRWRPVDAYINDDAFSQASARELRRHGWPEGFSQVKAYDPGTRFDLDADQFVQMDAIEGDDGVWTEPSDYYRSDCYRNRTGPLRGWLYRRAIRGANRRVSALRRQVERDQTQAA